MALDIKAIKSELLEVAAGEKPPADFVRQNDIMDMMIREYFNPASRAPQSMTLNAIAAGAAFPRRAPTATHSYLPRSRRRPFSINTSPNIK